MNKEIKEILDIERYRNKDGYVCNIILTPDEIHKLLDYITNLQEEVERLKRVKMLKELCESLLDECDAHNKYLQEKIDKALDKLYCYGEIFDSEILQEFQKEMESILNGGDE